MSLEDQHTDCKSLRAVPGRTADWDRGIESLKIMEVE